MIDRPRSRTVPLRWFRPAFAASPVRVEGLDPWLRALVIGTFLFGAVEIVAGSAFGHAASTASGLALIVYGIVVAVVRRERGLGDGTTVSVVLAGMLFSSIALSLVLPLGRAPLALVPVMGCLLAVAFGGPRTPVLVGLCWATALALAVVPMVGARETVIPEWFRLWLLVGTQAFAGSMSILLAFRLYGSLRGAVAVSRERELEARAFFDHALDAVITMDQRGVILNWNPRAEAMFGWTPEEATGRRLSETIIPPDLRAAHESGLRRAVATGRGPVFNTRTQVDALRRDGSLFPVELTVVPLELGGQTMYGGFIRDLSAEREADARLGLERQHRAEVAEALAGLRAHATVEDTAAAICAAVIEHTTMSIAGLYRFLPSGDAVALAVEAPPGAPVVVGRTLDRDRAVHLRDRSLMGPWIEEWHADDDADPYRRRWHDVGLTGSLHAPITTGEGVVGILILGTTEAVSTDVLTRHLSTAVEFGAVASALLGRELETQRGLESIRAALAEVIETLAFDSVFQPVVDFATRSAVGYEALTRFRDGTRPDLRFAEAHRHGMGEVLEIATMRASLSAARSLPGDSWLALNISPRLLLERRRIARILAEADRPVVLELAEHMAISDYADIKAAARALPAEVRLAVDDAGAGYAGLRHLVELSPAFVKLDLHLVRDLDRDRARQALIAGMAHFAASTSCTLIAEGIETQAELDALAALGVTIGQGFLLGRPAAAARFRPAATGLTVRAS